MNVLFTSDSSSLISISQVTSADPDLCGIIQGGGFRLTFDAEALSKQSIIMRVAAHTCIALMPEAGLEETLETLSSYLDFYQDVERVVAIPSRSSGSHAGVAGAPVHAQDLVLE